MTENNPKSIYRLAVIADIHGMLPPLETFLAEIMTDSVNAIIVAGDIVGGPQPHETLALLQEHNCRMILGNGEVNMLRMHRGTAPSVWWTDQQFALARWTYDHLEKEDFDFLLTLSEQIRFEIDGAEPIRVVHGAPNDVNKLMLPQKEPDIIKFALDYIEESYLIFGHTHIPGSYRHNGKLAVNPGALSNNLVGMPEVSYATLVWDGQTWEPCISKSEPAFDLLKESFVKTGFLQATRPLGRTFLESIYTGDNTSVDFILHAVDLAKKAGLTGFKTIPDKYWLEAAESFPWQFDI